jgi:hypothetical protein
MPALAGGVNTVRPAIVIELGGISYADGSIGPWLVSGSRVLVECRRVLSRFFVSGGVKLRRSTAVVRG